MGTSVSVLQNEKDLQDGSNGCTKDVNVLNTTELNT